MSAVWRFDIDQPARLRSCRSKMPAAAEVLARRSAIRSESGSAMLEPAARMAVMASLVMGGSTGWSSGVDDEGEVFMTPDLEAVDPPGPLAWIECEPVGAGEQ